MLLWWFLGMKTCSLFGLDDKTSIFFQNQPVFKFLLWTGLTTRQVSFCPFEFSYVYSTVLHCACDAQLTTDAVTAGLSPSLYRLVSHLPSGHVIARLEICRVVIRVVSLMSRHFHPLSPSVWWIRRLADACRNASKHWGQHSRKHRYSRRSRHCSRSSSHPTSQQNHWRGPGFLTGQPDWR